jgi:predicted site-specific integrase-resolvase
MNSNFFILSSLLFVLICSNGIETKLGLAKRSRFSNPNSYFQPTSQRINNLIKILGNKQNKVKEELIHNEIIDIIDSINWHNFGMKSAKNDPIESYNWYTRKG